MQQIPTPFAGTRHNPSSTWARWLPFSLVCAWLTLSWAPVLAQETPKFDPKAIQGLSLWLDASDSSSLFLDADGKNPVTEHRQPVAVWSDKSGSGNHASQEAEERRPAYAKDQQNGLSAIRFDGASQFFRADSFGANFSSNNWTAFLVVQSNSSSTNGSALMSVTTPDSYRRGFRYMPNCRPKRCLEFKSKAKRNQDVRSDTSIPDRWQLWEFVNEDGVVALSLDGDELARGTVTADALTDFHTTTVGGRPKGDGISEVWDGHLGEILFYNETLGKDPHSAVRNYLATKWQLDVRTKD